MCVLLHTNSYTYKHTFIGHSSSFASWLPSQMKSLGASWQNSCHQTAKQLLLAAPANSRFFFCVLQLPKVPSLGHFLWACTTRRRSHLLLSSKLILSAAAQHHPRKGTIFHSRPNAATTASLPEGGNPRPHTRTHTLPLFDEIELNFPLDCGEK